MTSKLGGKTDDTGFKRNPLAENDPRSIETVSQVDDPMIPTGEKLTLVIHIFIYVLSAFVVKPLPRSILQNDPNFPSFALCQVNHMRHDPNFTQHDPTNRGHGLPEMAWACLDDCHAIATWDKSLSMFRKHILTWKNVQMMMLLHKKWCSLFY